MCSAFFSSATVGGVATAILFLISFSPYILVMMFDANLKYWHKVGMDLSFTTAFSYAWGEVLRYELQQEGLTFHKAFKDGFESQFSLGLLMLVIDTVLYAIIGYFYQRWKEGKFPIFYNTKFNFLFHFIDDFRFFDVERNNLDINLGAVMVNVSKIYNDEKIALANITLSFPRNQVTCLLGRNGAGKSTIM